MVYSCPSREATYGEQRSACIARTSNMNEELDAEQTKELLGLCRAGSLYDIEKCDSRDPRRSYGSSTEHATGATMAAAFEVRSHKNTKKKESRIKLSFTTHLVVLAGAPRTLATRRTGWHIA
jgi:hypothetical protein